MDMIEMWLSKNKNLCGVDLTIADIVCACELIQSRFIAFDFAKWPKT